jgi:hypothetical protein
MNLLGVVLSIYLCRWFLILASNGSQQIIQCGQRLESSFDLTRSQIFREASELFIIIIIIIIIIIVYV